MGEFFSGKRRKIGVLTLGLACVFMAGWVSDIKAVGPNVSIQVQIDSVPQGVHVVVQHLEMVTEYYEKRGNVSTLKKRSHYSDWFSFTIPYWSVVIPLTLASLWLLLWKPRPAIQKKITEPIPEKVG